MIEHRRVTFGATIDQVVKAAAKVAKQFGRNVKYVSRDPSHTLVTTVQHSPGQDEVAFSLRPAGGRTLRGNHLIVGREHGDRLQQ